MNVDDAWESFIKSHQIRKSSIDEKLDMIASQMNELQTDVTRLAENIPEMQGDAAALDTANAMAGPEPQDPGMDALGAILGETSEEEVPEGEAPMGEAPMDEPLPEESAPIEGDAGAPMPEEAPIGGAEEPMPGDMGGDDLSDDELDAILGGGDMGAPEMGGTNGDMISKIKELIMNEDDPGKLSALSELLSMAASSDETYSMESFEETDTPDDLGVGPEMLPETEPMGKSEKFGKSIVDTPEEAKDASEDAVKAENLDAPNPENGEKTLEPVEKSCPMNELMSRIMEAITPVVAEFVGAAPATANEPEVVIDVEELPLDEESEEAPVEKEPEANEPDVEGEDKAEEEKEDEDSEKEYPEDKISEETDHFEESECDTEPVEKSFRDMFAKKREFKAGIDGAFAKVPAYAQEDAGGKHIMSFSEVASILKSDRPDTSSTVNGSIDRPDIESFRKSGTGPVSFRELMNSSDPHTLMKKEWDEYNLFKSTY